jgi:hypothetical protein
VTRPPDFDRIAELAKRLDEICREAEHLRAQIESNTHEPPIWPTDQSGLSMFEHEKSGRRSSKKPEPL